MEAPVPDLPALRKWFGLTIKAWLTMEVIFYQSVLRSDPIYTSRQMIGVYGRGIMELIMYTPSGVLLTPVRLVIWILKPYWFTHRIRASYNRLIIYWDYKPVGKLWQEAHLRPLITPARLSKINLGHLSFRLKSDICLLKQKEGSIFIFQ
jgi:hypothetical protein